MGSSKVVESEVHMVGDRPKSNISGDGKVRFEKSGTTFFTSLAHGIIGFSDKLIRFTKKKRGKIRSNHDKNR